VGPARIGTRGGATPAPLAVSESRLPLRCSGPCARPASFLNQDGARAPRRSQCSHGWPAERRAGERAERERATTLGATAASDLHCRPCAPTRRSARQPPPHPRFRTSHRRARIPRVSQPLRASGQQWDFAHARVPRAPPQSSCGCAHQQTGGSPLGNANHRLWRGARLRECDAICTLARACPDGQRGRETSRCPRSASTLDPKLSSAPSKCEESDSPGEKSRFTTIR